MNTLESDDRVPLPIPPQRKSSDDSNFVQSKVESKEVDNVRNELRPSLLTICLPRSSSTCSNYSHRSSHSNDQAEGDTSIISPSAQYSRMRSRSPTDILLDARGDGTLSPAVFLRNKMKSNTPLSNDREIKESFDNFKYAAPLDCSKKMMSPRMLASMRKSQNELSDRK